MLDHLGIAVPTDKYEETVNFYLAALAPLGYERRFNFTEGALVSGLGTEEGRADFWITGIKEVPMGNHAHYAFAGKKNAAIDEFHSKAVAAGAKDNGAPGIRADYHPSYYAAYVIDPVGNRIEAVCHKEE